MGMWEEALRIVENIMSLFLICSLRLFLVTKQVFTPLIIKIVFKCATQTKLYRISF